MTTTDIWSFGRHELKGLDLTGYYVEATDGPIGRIDTATHDVGASYIVVDTGIWQTHGSRIVLPAATIARQGAGKVFLNRTRREVAEAPPFNSLSGFDSPERAMLDSYYRAHLYAQEPWEEHKPEAPERSREQIYAEARELGIHGRSKMDKSQLARAVAAARNG
jgi:hypothetical protein